MSEVLSDYWTERFETSQQDDDAPLVALETLPVAPLDMQFGVHPPKTVPDEIQAALSGQTPLYAVIDAALIDGLPEILTASGLRAESLYIGDEGEEMADVAPYLVSLTHDAGLLRQLFSQSGNPLHWWDRSAAILMASDVPFDALHGHLRRLLRLRDAQGKWTIFRFWDGALLRRLFIAARATFPDPLKCFAKGEKPIISKFVLPDPKSGTVTIATPNANAPDGALQLTPEFVKAMQAYSRERFAQTLLTHCSAAFPATFGALKPDKSYQLMLDGIEQARRFNVTKRGPVTSFMEMRLNLGIGFADDPMCPWAAEILHKITPQTQMAAADALFARYAEYHRAVHGPGSTQFIAAMARAETVVEKPADQTHAAMLQAVFPEKYAYLGPDGIQAFLNAIRAQLQGHGRLDLRSTRVYILLCFFMGHRCAEDPQYGWIGDALERSWDHGTETEDSPLVRKTRVWFAAAKESAGLS